MAYATVADLKKCQRWPTIADLVASGQPGGVRPTEAELDDDPVLAAMLEQASGRIKAALRQGERYSVDDLDGLTGDDQALLVRLTCDLAWAALLRRGLNAKAAEDYAKDALETLELLRTGVNIFDLTGRAEAGLPDSSGPSVIEITNANSIEQRTRNYFAGPIQRLPIDQQR